MKRENKVERLLRPDYRTSYKATVIKQCDHNNGIYMNGKEQSTKIYPHLYH